MSRGYEVIVGAGVLRATSGVSWPHRWTADGVTVEADFTGGHLLHLATAACVLNDLYREAATLGIELDGVRVSAGGGFDAGSGLSTGVEYSVELASAADDDSLRHLLEVVDDVAEVPRTLRAGTTVRRVG